MRSLIQRPTAIGQLLTYLRVCNYHRVTAFVLVVFGLVVQPSFANSETQPIRTAAEAVQSADRAFASGDFRNAVSLYLQAQKLGATNGYTEYNLGNAYFRSGQPGRAIAHLRRSQSLLGTDPETEANLRFVRNQLKERSIANCPSGSRPLDLPSPLGATETQRLWTSLCLWCFFWTMLGIGVFYGSALLRFITVAALLTSLATGAIYFQTIPGSTGEPCFKYFFGGTQYRSAVVVTPQIEVRSGDTAEAQVVAVLKEGAEISTAETRNGYIQIFLPTGRSGFVPLDSVELI
jgi:tetratricopeptide (TPR) repeat protein